MSIPHTAHSPRGLIQLKVTTQSESSLEEAVLSGHVLHKVQLVHLTRKAKIMLEKENPKRKSLVYKVYWPRCRMSMD